MDFHGSPLKDLTRDQQNINIVHIAKMKVMKMSVPNTSAARRLAENLLPIVHVAGEDRRLRMEQRLIDYGCAGVSVAVIEGGEIAWAAGYGSIEHDGNPVDDQTMFSGASISKPVTATIAMQLVERGVFDLDIDVNRYIQGWRVPENEFTAQAPVTLRWLLSHKAGTTVHGFDGAPADAPMPSLQDILEGRPPALNAPVRVDKVPGGGNRYSGGGTTIVELMIEEATGKRYEDVAREMIFEPLGMSRSTFTQPLPPELRANAAEGMKMDGSVTPRDFVMWQRGAGGLWTTPSDYARFMIAIRDAVLGEPNPLLGPGFARMMMKRQGGGEFGLGWYLANEGAERYFHHSGSNGGFQCNALCYEQAGKGAVVMTNAESGLSFYWEILNGLAAIHDWPGFLQPKRRIVPIDPADFGRHVGSFGIVSGVEFPMVELFVENGGLRSRIPGMIGGEQDVLRDERGCFFNRSSPFETWPEYDADGLLVELVVRNPGGMEIMRARRQ